MRWQDLHDQQPRLGTVVADRLIEPGVLLLVSLRKDGTPRLSPVEPFVLDGDLWLGMLLGSRKAADLARDPRCLVHSIITSAAGQEGEVKLRGSAAEVTALPRLERYAAAVAEALPWAPEPGRFHLFRIEIDEVAVIRYDNPTGDQYLTRWPAGVETVRRGTSATSLAEPEPIRQLLGPD